MLYLSGNSDKKKVCTCSLQIQVEAFFFIRAQVNPWMLNLQAWEAASIFLKLFFLYYMFIFLYVVFLSFPLPLSFATTYMLYFEQIYIY